MANDIPASIMLIMKKMMLLLALLFCGQSLFANYYLKPTGSLGLILTGLASVVGRDLALRTWEEDDDDGDADYAIGDHDEAVFLEAVASEDDDEDSDSEEDDISEIAPETEDKNTGPENSEDSSEDPNTFLLPETLEDLPDSVIVDIFLELSDKDLGQLSLVSQKIGRIAQYVLNSNLREIRRIQEGISAEENPLNRTIVAERITAALTAKDKHFNESQRKQLLKLALEELVNDDHKWIRGVTAKIIGDLFEKLSTEELKALGEDQLLHALIGETGQSGIARDKEEHVRIEVAKAVAQILKSEAVTEANRDLLLDVLLGTDGKGGLRKDAQHYVKVEGRRTVDLLFMTAGEVLNEAQYCRIEKAFANRIL